MGEQLKPEQLVELIASIYEAAVDPAVWPVFLERFAAAIRAPAGLPQGHDLPARGAPRENHTGPIPDGSGFDPEFLNSYAEFYAEVNVWARSEAVLAEGVTVNASMLNPDVDLPRTGYHTDWLCPQDLRDAVREIAIDGALPGASSSAVRLVGLGEPPMSELAFCRLLVPHLQRACALHRKLTRVRAIEANGPDALELAPWGVWLFDEKGTVIHANRAAAQVAVRAAGLWLDAKRRPVTADPEQTTSLHRLIEGAVRAGARSSKAAGGGMLVRRAGSGAALHVQVLPLPARNLLLGSSAAAVAFISDQGRSELAPEASLTRSYGLTPAEARLVAALVKGVAVKQYATLNKRSENTVRSHLKSAMSKLGVRRQSDLVRLLMTMHSAPSSAARD